MYNLLKSLSMGAHSFLHKIVTSDPKGTYEHLVKEAYYYHGHDSYNGTISTTSGLKEHRMGFETDEQVDAWLVTDEPWDLTDKWGPCGYVQYPESQKIAFFGWAAE
jgi:hypothetical protein